eukprot:7459821-Pyramimonas_sp.AAC.1
MLCALLVAGAARGILGHSGGRAALDMLARRGPDRSLSEVAFSERWVQAWGRVGDMCECHEPEADQESDFLVSLCVHLCRLPACP